jgi:protein O-GlcNAc transferase
MELTLNEALQKAIEAHRAGQIQEADRLYTAILQAQPKHPDANHNMGVLAVGVGKLQESLPFFKTALEANPSIGQYWLSHIDALIKLDRMVDAKAVLAEAKEMGVKGEISDQLEQRLNSPNEVSIDPPQDQLQSLINLYQQGQFQQALDNTKQLLSQFANSLTLYNIQGAANESLGQLDAAIDSFKKALKINPDYAEAYNNMGAPLKNKGDLDAAIDSYKQALKIRPDYAEAYNNMGNAL